MSSDKVISPPSGFIAAFVDYARDFTGCPDPFLEWAATLTLSAVAGRAHVLRRGDWDVVPNLWVLLLGKSSSYKSTGLAIARRLLREAHPACLLGQEYSTEAMLDEIAENPHRLFTYDEAETFFLMLRQKYNLTMKSALMTLWRDDWYKRKTKKGEIIIKDAYLCFGGASTPVQIAGMTASSDSDLLSGLLPRFCLVPYFGKEVSLSNPPPANAVKRQALIDRLSVLASGSGREYKYSSSALTYMDDWQRRFDKRISALDPLLGAFFRKMRDEHFHKLAILSAFERGSALIDLSDLERVVPRLYYIEKSLPQVLRHLTDTPYTRLKERVHEWGIFRGKVTKTDLHKEFSHAGAKVLQTILQDLELEGLIAFKHQPGTTKPAIEVEFISS